MNTKLVAAVGSALMVASVGANAIEAKVSGHINRALMWADDGFDTELFNADGGPSKTRFRFTGSGELSPDVKAGINWEVQWPSNATDAVSMTSKNAAATLGERYGEIYFQGAFGKVSLGQGDGAAKDTQGTDLSGTGGLLNSAATADIGKGIAFRTSTGGTGPTVGTVFDDLNFEGRYDRLRYDSPALGPVTLAGSFGHTANDIKELALRLNTSMGGGKLAAALGFSVEDTQSAAGNEETKGASISWLASFGLNVTVGVAKKEDDAAAPLDASFNWIKVGYLMGPHAFAVDVSTTDDRAATGDEARQMGVAYVYTANKWAEFYAGGKALSLDRPGSNLEDITIITGGSRLKF